MTNKEIREMAERLYNDIGREVGRGGSSVQVPMIEEALKTVARRAEEEGLEDDHQRPDPALMHQIEGGEPGCFKTNMRDICVFCGKPFYEWKGWEKCPARKG